VDDFYKCKNLDLLKNSEEEHIELKINEFNLEEKSINE